MIRIDDAMNMKSSRTGGRPLRNGRGGQAAQVPTGVPGGQSRRHQQDGPRPSPGIRHGRASRERPRGQPRDRMAGGLRKNGRGRGWVDRQAGEHV